MLMPMKIGNGDEAHHQMRAANICRLYNVPNNAVDHYDKKKGHNCRA